MNRRIIALSGPIAAGKSELANVLADRFGMHLFKTRELISEEIEGTPLERVALQKAGETLDKRTGGKWIAHSLARQPPNVSDSANVIVDAVRIENQIAGLREIFPGRVIHVHLTAPPEELKKRYRNRAGELKEPPSYDDVRSDPTEAKVEDLADVADVVIDTKQCTRKDVVTRAAAHLGLYGRNYRPLVDVLIGGQWGSEGKGHVASYLAPEYEVLVRVGGPNAGHKVYRDPDPLTYHHLPSGTRECKAKIVIGPGAVLRPPNLLKEIAACELSKDRLFIDPQAMVIEDADVDSENENLVGIASTKQGVGAATSRKVLRPAAVPPVRLAKDIPELKHYITETCEVLDAAFRDGQHVFLEGTQGTGLSLHHGEYPYVTSRDTTVSGCLAEAGIAPSRVRRIIMLIRSYPIRVGGKEESGPMGIELKWPEVARRSGQSKSTLYRNERTSTTNRLRRVAEFNWSMLRKAASLNGPTDIALSFADYIKKANEDARRFEQLTPDTIKFIEEIERVGAAPVSLITTRFHHSNRSIIDRPSLPI